MNDNQDIELKDFASDSEDAANKPGEEGGHLSSIEEQREPTLKDPEHSTSPVSAATATTATEGGAAKSDTKASDEGGDRETAAASQTSDDAQNKEKEEGGDQGEEKAERGSGSRRKRREDKEKADEGTASSFHVPLGASHGASCTQQESHQRRRRWSPRRQYLCSRRVLIFRPGGPLASLWSTCSCPSRSGTCSTPSLTTRTPKCPSFGTASSQLALKHRQGISSVLTPHMHTGTSCTLWSPSAIRR